MDFNFTSEEYNKTFHLMENVSLDEQSMNVYSALSAEMMIFYVSLFLIVEILGNFLLLSMIFYEKYESVSKQPTQVIIAAEIRH